MIVPEVIRSRRRTLSLELCEDGRLLLRAPLRCPERELRAFVEQHRGWIERKCAEQEARRREREAVPPLREDELAALQKRGRQVFAERAAHFAPLVGVRYGRISVRRQRSKWGSCSGKGNLNFNWKLIMAPPPVLDYVVIHELCHLWEFNHSPRFWSLVEQQMPEYRVWKKWLKQHAEDLNF